MSLILDQLKRQVPEFKSLKGFGILATSKRHHPGDRPFPSCVFIKSSETQSLENLWLNEQGARGLCPFTPADDWLLISFSLDNHLQIFHELGWRIPRFCLDLFAEFRRLSNGLERRLGDGRFETFTCPEAALRHLGLSQKPLSPSLPLEHSTPSAAHDDAVDREKSITTAVCEVEKSHQLFLKLFPSIDFPRACLRAKFCKVAAKIELNGVPVDEEKLERLLLKKERVISEFVGRAATAAPVFGGSNLNPRLFRSYLNREGYLSSWPLDALGRVRLDKEAFDEMSTLPGIEQIAEVISLQKHLSQRRLLVGKDGRNRASLRPFVAKTGRSAPRSSESIAACSKWFQHFIQPTKGLALVQADWEQQEFGIAAALSGDSRMWEAYASGDPYLAMGKQAGSIPPEGNRRDFAVQRALYKQCALGILYGMGAQRLGRRVKSLTLAEYLIGNHRKTYPRFWSWINSAVKFAYANSYIDAVFGWRLNITEHTKPTTVFNFPMQANGAEMMRLAAIFADEAGLKIIAIIHDAFLIECDADKAEEQGELLKRAMAKASKAVLSGFELRSEVKVFRHPARIECSEKSEFFSRILAQLEEPTTTGA